MSPQHVISYIVFWQKKSEVMGSSVALHGVKYRIDDLHSNTKYEVMVQAIGSFENINSTIKNFYTAPNEMKGNSAATLLHTALMCVKS